MINIIPIIPPSTEQKSQGWSALIECLQWGFSELGHVVKVAPNQIARGAQNIVLGFQMLSPQAIQTLPEDTIVYNLEQIAGLPVEALRPGER